MTTNTDLTEIFFPALLDVLNDIRVALQDIAAGMAPAAPDWKHDIADFANFDWSGIGAVVKTEDQFGPATVEYRGQLYTRRSPENKFGTAIWYSRPTGKTEDGSVSYARLITFKPFAQAEPLSRKAEAEASAAAAQKPANGQRPPATARQAAVEGRGPWPHCDVCGQVLPHHAPSCSVGRDERARVAKAAFLAQQGEQDFAGLPSAAQEPAQARALASAAANHAAAEAPAEELPFKDQGTAVKWAAQFAHYQKPDGSPDYPHAVGSHANLCKALGCSDKHLECWGQAWLRHVHERA